MEILEIEISLDRLQGYFEFDSLSLNIKLSGKITIRSGVMKRRIGFFSKGRKLISQFRGREFRETWKN
jgi:hypothetical protein